MRILRGISPISDYIAGQDPVKFLQRLLGRVSHVPVKDVSESLPKALRGGEVIEIRISDFQNLVHSAQDFTDQ